MLVVSFCLCDFLPGSYVGGSIAPLDVSTLHSQKILNESLLTFLISLLYFAIELLSMSQFPVITFPDFPRQEFVLIGLLYAFFANSMSSVFLLCGVFSNQFHNLCFLVVCTLPALSDL